MLHSRGYREAPEFLALAHEMGADQLGRVSAVVCINHWDEVCELPSFTKLSPFTMATLTSAAIRRWQHLMRGLKHSEGPAAQAGPDESSDEDDEGDMFDINSEEEGDDLFEGLGDIGEDSEAAVDID